MLLDISVPLSLLRDFPGSSLWVLRSRYVVIYRIATWLICSVSTFAVLSAVAAAPLRLYPLAGSRRLGCRHVEGRWEAIDMLSVSQNKCVIFISHHRLKKCMEFFVSIVTSRNIHGEQLLLGVIKMSYGVRLYLGTRSSSGPATIVQHLQDLSR